MQQSQELHGSEERQRGCLRRLDGLEAQEPRGPERVAPTTCVGPWWGVSSGAWGPAAWRGEARAAAEHRGDGAGLLGGGRPGLRGGWRDSTEQPTDTPRCFC